MIKKNKILRLLTCAVLAALVIELTGCASIMSGTKQTVKIKSTPDGASVKIERITLAEKGVEFEGKTPVQTKLYRKGSYLVTITMPGYEKMEIPIQDGGMNGWVVGNIIFGGIIGIIIDSSNGAAIHLNPDEIQAQLVATKSAQNNGRDQLYAVIYSADREGKTVAHAFPLQAAQAN